MKRLFLPAILLSATIQGKAQFGDDYLRAADKYYTKADYASAAAYYEKFLHGGKTAAAEYDPYKVTISKTASKGNNRQQAVYHLAESYRLLTNFEKADPIYKDLLQQAPDATPIAWFQYASVLRALGRYAEAEQALHTFLDKYKANDAYTQSAQRELKNLQFIQQQLAKQDGQQYNIQKITGGRDGASYAPVVITGNTLLFTTTWPDSSAAGKSLHVNHIMQAQYNGSAIENTSTVLLAGATAHTGTPAISEDGNTLYFTRWRMVEGKKAASIYKSSKTATGWSEPVALNEQVNEVGANAQQPVLLNGKYLLFASDKKGGYGGYDLWIAELNAQGEPVSSTNLGEAINTSFNEEAPFYQSASNTLVFATNGRVGMGGYDLFYSKGEPGHWQEPQNMGYPVNSVKDDIYFTSNRSSKKLLENAFISSDRTATCCLELFHVSKTYTQYFTGTVVDCASKQPIAATNITVTSGQSVTNIVTNDKGEYAVTVPYGAVLSIKGEKDKYEPGQLTTSSKATTDTVLNEALCLTVIPKKKKVFEETKLEVRNILFGYNDATIPESDYSFLDQVATYLKEHPKAKIEIGAHTDGIGSVSFNLKLSARRAQSCLTYLTQQGIDKKRMIAKGYGECCPLEPELTDDKQDNPAAREKNRRIEIKLL